jgi:hypothetical protein
VGLDIGVSFQISARYGGDDVLGGGGRVDDDELVLAPALGVVARLPLFEPELILLLEEPGEQFAEQQKNEAEVNQLYAGLFPRQGEAFDVGGDEVDQQQRTDEIAARENRDREALDVLEDDEALEPFLLHRPDAEVDLVDGGQENEQGREAEQRHGEAQRDEELYEGIPDVAHGSAGGLNGLDERNERVFLAGDEGVGSG